MNHCHPISLIFLQMIKFFPTFIIVLFLAIETEKVAGQNCNAEFTWNNQCNVVQFNSTDTTSGLKYKWSFGDGNVDSVKSPSHIYYVNNPGNYNFTVSFSSVRL